jgi:hypothetical protein
MAFSCQELKTEKPAVVKITKSLEPKVSTVKLPILLPVSELENLINSQIESIIYEDLSFSKPKKDNLMLRVKREGRISIYMEGNKIYSSFPLSVWAKVKKVVAVESDFLLTLHLVSEIAIDANWKPILKTKFRSLKWEETPELKIGFVKINLTKPVENALADKMPVLLKKIDSIAHEKVNLRKKIAKIWSNLQKPVLVNKEYEKIWLVAEPKSISLEKINAHEGMIHLNTEIKSMLNFHFNDEPKVKNIPLPKLKHKKSKSDEFDIYLLAKVPFEEMRQKALREVKGKEFSFKDYSATLSDLTIEGTENGLLVMIEVTGDAKGKLYFTGIPKYDSISTEIKIDNFDFDVNTESVLATSADWLLHDDVKTMIQKELHVQLKPFSDKLPELIEHGIAKSKSGKKVSVKFNNFWFEPEEMLLNNDNLQILIHARGAVELKLSHLVQ